MWVGPGDATAYAREETANGFFSFYILRNQTRVPAHRTNRGRPSYVILATTISSSAADGMGACPYGIARSRLHHGRARARADNHARRCPYAPAEIVPGSKITPPLRLCVTRSRSHAAVPSCGCCSSGRGRRADSRGGENTQQCHTHTHGRSGLTHGTGGGTLCSHAKQRVGSKYARKRVEDEGGVDVVGSGQGQGCCCCPSVMTDGERTHGGSIMGGCRRALPR